MRTLPPPTPRPSPATPPRSRSACCEARPELADRAGRRAGRPCAGTREPHRRAHRLQRGVRAPGRDRPRDRDRAASRPTTAASELTLAATGETLRLRPRRASGPAARAPGSTTSPGPRGRCAEARRAAARVRRGPRLGPAAGLGAVVVGGAGAGGGVRAVGRRAAGPSTGWTLVLIAQRAENGYRRRELRADGPVRVDRSGAEGHALLLDCRTLEHRADRAAPTPTLALVACHSGSPRRLESSAYNERRSQCEAAVAVIAADGARRDGAARRDARRCSTPPGPRLDPLVAARAEHIVHENARVAARPSRRSRPATSPAVGRLFAASHASMRDLFGISSPELDALVEIALGRPGRDRRATHGRRASAAARSTWSGATRCQRSARRCCATTRRGPGSRRACSRSTPRAARGGSPEDGRRRPVRRQERRPAPTTARSPRSTPSRTAAATR